MKLTDTYRRMKARGYAGHAVNTVQQIRFWSQELTRAKVQLAREQALGATGNDLAPYRALISKARSEVKRRSSDLKRYREIVGVR